MQDEKSLIPDYLFEVSWEVCNKVGGIHTVIASKVPTIKKVLKKPHIMIGPDVVKEDEQNPEFTEDPILMKAWKTKAANDGLHIRIGHWNIAEEPTTILIDFTSFFSQKDEILRELWEKHKLDSISGQWDYIEPTLFGYAAGKVIESYIQYHCTPSDKIIAQFHEWMTGAGLLYLKSTTPQVGCAFTTHATVLGRSIAGNNLPLYDNLKNYNPETISSNFGVTAKQSLEKITAQEADVFTTVSDITAKECEQFLGKSVDIVTPNGFQDFFENYPDSIKNQDGRSLLKQVAEGILARPIDNNALFIGTSGRYEFKNKGIDIFIEALGKLNKSEDLNREVVGFILVPAGHHGPLSQLLQNLKDKKNATPLANPYLSHELNDEQYDPILNAIEKNKLFNTINDKVKIFFIPSYLNGNDGIFNVPYYTLLAGLDLSLFPSYYEPWGYTPLESVAFKVPTITTTLAGFGLWVKMHHDEDRPGIAVIDRTDTNDDEVIKKMQFHILRHTQNNQAQVKKAKENAYEVSKIALWDNLIYYYTQAYSNALVKVSKRYTEKDFVPNEPQNNLVVPQMCQSTTPNWFNIILVRNIPEKLKALEVLSKNLWWCWNQDAIDLFESIDPEVWENVEHNPIVLLDTINYQKYQELEQNADFVERLESVYNHFKEYMNKTDDLSEPTITYFCMEYGLHTSLKIYSGGLGILAGDYLKEASDKGVRMTGIGLLYRYGYFRQRLSTSGEQENIYEAQEFDKIPVTPLRDENDNWITIQIGFPGRNMTARVWKVDVGRVELFLFDTDFEENSPEDRSITYHLYGGDWENRLKQELLLGVGGIRLLQKLNRHSNIYHCNEGHAAFTGLEHIHQLMVNHNLSFDEAKEIVRSFSLFTTHTPVPAGHDAFDEGLLRKYISHYPERFKVDWETIMGLGRVNPNDHNEKFSMSNLAVNLSQEVNGVSWLHGKVSQDMFKGLFPGYLASESYIGYVTNGVHYPTWAAPQWKRLYEREFGEDFATHHYDKSCFSKIQNVDDREIWDIRSELRSTMIEYIKERIRKDNDLMYYSPREIVEIVELLDPNKLTFGFARRFATYKRAQLLFTNLDTLDEIVNHPTCPVQFIFAGKAHPADKAGQDLIKKIVEISKYPQFLGKILFIENYDMDLAAKLVQGVDIWLNTPTRPMEASGTSGEKAVMNGVMHFSVLDGWWVEGYQKDAGWALPLKQTYENNDFQNELDAETVYSTIENEIAPLFYKRDNDGIPHKWIQHVKNSIDKVASNFTMNRQLTDYEERFYNKLYKRSKEMRADNYAMAKDIVLWKHQMQREWDNVEILSVKIPNAYKEDISVGKEYNLEITLSCGAISPENIGVELIITKPNHEGEIDEFIKKSKFTCVSSNGNTATYSLKYIGEQSGTYSVGVRIYAQNKLLVHQQDSGLVKWL